MTREQSARKIFRRHHIGEHCHFNFTHLSDENMTSALKKICFFKHSPKLHTKLKKQVPNDMPENSRSQLIILRNTRWVVRFSVLEVFRYVYNAAIKAMCKDIVYELTPRNSKSASKATLSLVYMCSSSPLITRPYHLNRLLGFGSRRHSRCSLVGVRS